MLVHSRNHSSGIRPKGLAYERPHKIFTNRIQEKLYQSEPEGMHLSRASNSYDLLIALGFKLHLISVQ